MSLRRVFLLLFCGLCLSGCLPHWMTMHDRVDGGPAPGGQAAHANTVYHRQLLRLARELDSRALPVHFVNGQPWRRVGFWEVEKNVALRVWVGGDDVQGSFANDHEARARAVLKKRAPAVLAAIAAAGLMAPDLDFQTIELGVSFTTIESGGLSDNLREILIEHHAMAEALILVDAARKLARKEMTLRSVLKTARTSLDGQPLRLQ